MTGCAVRCSMKLLEILTAAWSGQQVYHHGPHYTVDGIQFLPRPAQRPGVPVWATVGTILTAAGFADVNITGVHEPVYYGSDAASALRVMLSLQMTRIASRRSTPRAPDTRSASCAPPSPPIKAVAACSSTRAPG